MKRALALRLLLLAALLAAYCFIFGNSATVAKDSIAKSDKVIEVVEPVVKPVIEKVTKKPVTYEIMNFFVRKTAHFIEFCVLGALWAGLALALPKPTWERAFLPLFSSLASAVTDEFIQSFLDRTSSLKDVVLDFTGAFLGMTAVFCAFLLIRALVRRKKRREA